MSVASDRTMLEIALRVLSAWCGREQPRAEDVAALRALYPDREDLGDDELASCVVKQVVIGTSCTCSDPLPLCRAAFTA